MGLPTVTAEDIVGTVPGVSNVGTPCRGGQKLVFPCTIASSRYALKILLAEAGLAQPSEADSMATVEDSPDEVTSRAIREVAIMKRCRTPYLVKLGPISLTRAEMAGQHVVFFTEEWVDGEDLRTIIRRSGPLSLPEVVRLGKQVAAAIDELWSLGVVHRDVKPGNIMRRAVSKEFVLLDMGLALDLHAQSLTAFGIVPGTQLYLSPDQLDYARKRMLDFRSDLFSLGIVLYECTTGTHPFWTNRMTSAEAVGGILTAHPERPSARRNEVPPELDGIILRLLAKKPHLRFRTCGQLVQAFEAVRV